MSYTKVKFIEVVNDAFSQPIEKEINSLNCSILKNNKNYKYEKNVNSNYYDLVILINNYEAMKAALDLKLKKYIVEILDIRYEIVMVASIFNLAGKLDSYKLELKEL